MKIKNVKLEWYILQYDHNKNKMQMENILWRRNIPEEIAKKIRKGKKDNWKPVYDYNTFKEWIKGELMYYYWSKTEHECLIGDYCTEPIETLEKHDIWWQLEPNIDRICEYIIKEMQIEWK